MGKEKKDYRNTVSIYELESYTFLINENIDGKILDKLFKRALITTLGDTNTLLDKINDNLIKIKNIMKKK